MKIASRVRALLAAELLIGSIAPGVLAIDGTPSSWGSNFHTSAANQALSTFVHHSSAPAVLPINMSGTSAQAAAHAFTNQAVAGWTSHQAVLNHAHPGNVSSQANSLDLSSIVAGILLKADVLGPGQSATIDLGGNSHTFFAGDKVTAAEYLAIEQVSSGSAQSLQLSASGAARGGNFNLNLIGQATSKLVIPAGVTGLDYFSTNSTLGVNGNIVVYGSLYGLSTSSDTTSGTIFAKNITNHYGGIISTELPSSLAGTISGAISNVDLTLSATNNITNSGTMSSSGALTLVAGGAIANTAIQTGLPAISAQGNVTLISGSGNFQNSGIISSAVGNINIAAMNAATNINIDAVGGSFVATAGDINVRSALSGPAGDIILSGGDYTSHNLNLFAEGGEIAASVGKVSGHLNTLADIEHFTASTELLTLGNNCLTGDPTFVNTAVGGGIVIDGVNTFTENVAILANGDITTTNAAQIKANGANVTIIAGAKTATTGKTTTKVGTNPADQKVTVILDQSVSNGGSILFDTGAAATVIDTSTGNGQGSAGSVMLVAMASSGGSGGKVLLGTNSIDTRANGIGPGHNGGNVTIIAGANPGTKTDTITVGAITASPGLLDRGGNNSYEPQKGGAILVATQQPQSSNADKTIVFDTKGNYTGTITPNGKSINNASVVVNGDLNTSGGTNAHSPAGFTGDASSANSITIIAGADVTTKNIFAFGGGGAGGNQGLADDPGKGGNGAKIEISSVTGNISIAGTVSSAGGGGGGGTGRNQNGKGGPDPGTAGAKGGTGADISIVSPGGSIAVTGGVYAADGGDGGSGGNPSTLFGGGGGGGGSYGAGGGGGADSLQGGGGGGGGIFGGGGGGTAGGDGANGYGGGAGFGGGSSGSAGVGGKGFGNNLNNGGAGGTIGLGGTGAGTSVFKAPGGTGGSASGGKTTVAIKAGSGGVTVGDVFGGSVSINATGAKDLSVGSVTGPTSVSLTAVDGNILQGAGKTFSSGNLTLFTGKGTIGTILSPISIATGLLSVSTGTTGGTASVVLNDSQAVTIETGQAIGGQFILTAGGSIGTKAGTTLTATAVTLDSSGFVRVTTQTSLIATTSIQDTVINNTGSLSVDKSTSSFSPYELHNSNGTKAGDNATVTILDNITTTGSGGKITIDIKTAPGQKGGIVTSKPVVLTANKIVISDTSADDIASNANPLGIASGVNVVVCDLQVTSKGSAFIASTGAVTVHDSTFGSKNNKASFFTITTTPDAAGKGQVIIGKAGITGLSSGPASPSTITLNGSNKVNLGGIGLGTNAGDLVADRIFLSDNSVGGTSTIGTPTAPIKINATFLHAETQSDVYVKNSNNTNLDLDTVNLAVGSRFSVQSAGNIDTGGKFGTVTSGTILLDVPAGKSIGTKANPALISGQDITLNGGVDVYAKNTTTTAINLTNFTLDKTTIVNQASGTYSMIAPTATTFSVLQGLKAADVVIDSTNFSNPTNGAITATKSISITSSGANPLTINLPLSAPNITLQADTGAISQTTTGSIKASKLLTLIITDTGVVGNVNLTNASNDVLGLSTKVSGANLISFSDVKDVVLSSIVGDKQSLKIDYNGTISTSVPFTVNLVDFTPIKTNVNGSIKIGAPITTTQQSTLIVSGTGSIESAGLISTGNWVLTAQGTGSIKLNGPTTGNQVTLTTNGGNIIQSATAPVNSKAPLTLFLNAAGTADLSKAPGDFSNMDDTVVGKGVVKVSSLSPLGLTLGTITGTAQLLTATAAQTIVANTLNVAELSLTSNGPGGIGGPSVTTSAAKISVNATSANANATVISTNPAGALIHNSSAGATLSISTAGPATISDLSGTTITVTSAAGVQEQGNIGTKLSNVTLTAGGTGSITRLRVVDKIVGASVTMNTSGGAIGGPTVVATIGVETSNLTVNTTSVGTGGIFILNTSKDPLTVANATSNQGFSLYSYGPVTVNSITAGSDVNASTNSITVGARSGALIVNPASMLVATGGSVLLQNDDTKGGTINIGTGSTITGSSTVAGVGTVTINIGPTANKFVGTTPDNVTVNNTAPGVTYFGKNGITALGPVNTINANKRDVIFDTDDKAANSITLGGGVIITADPPEGLADLPAARTIAPAFTASAIAPATQSVGAVQSSAVNSPFILPTIAPAQSFATVIAGLNGNMLDSLMSSSGGLQAQARTLYGGIGAFAQPGNVQYGLINANVHTACDSAEASINSGGTLYIPDRDMVVKTTFGDVKIAAHSMALVMAFNHGIAVYDLDDTHHQSVVVEVGGRKIALAPSKHLFVTGSQYDSFEEINPSAVIPYKGVTKTAINDSLAAFSADFHLPAAVYTIVPLRNMLASTDAGHKSRTSHLLKTAAIMLQLGNYASGYRTYTRPRLTAMR